jgi:hypothetical protein
LGAADIATLKLRENSSESTTATMPYVSSRITSALQYF